MSALRDDIQAKVEASHQEVKAWREHLHAHPELSFEEYETAAFVADKLSAWGIPHQTGVAKTGIVAHIEGKHPGSRVIALRADMDALPILEANEVPYRSQKEGVMHACGHDVHTASLLGAAHILQTMRAHFEGTIKLLFQPSEERLPGGAAVMIREGALLQPTPAKIWGQHVHPPLEAGKIGMKQGPYMASADEVYLTVKGKGGHAAIPRNFIDPILIASHIIIALQQVVSRRAEPSMPTVLSFGDIHADGATNVIPAEVRIKGTFRTFDEAWRKEAHELIRQIATQTAQAMGGSCEARVEVGYPFVYNDPELTARTKALAIEYLGEENVVDLPLRMTGEDFAFFSQVMPGTFYRLGTGNPAKGITSPIHTATFDIDPDALKVGVGMLVWLACKG